MIPAGSRSSVPVWCFLGLSVPVYVILWVVCASVVCFQLRGVVCASVVCFQLGGGLLCLCGVLSALRGSSVPMWCASRFEGVICAIVV